MIFYRNISLITLFYFLYIFLFPCGAQAEKYKERKVQSEYVVVSEKGKTLILKDFKMGYQENGKGKVLESNSVPYGVGTTFGFFFKLPIIDPGDSIKLEANLKIPWLEGYDKKKVLPDIIPFAFKNPNKPNFQAFIYLQFDKGDIEIMKVPGEFEITLRNAKKIFTSQVFKVYLP